MGWFPELVAMDQGSEICLYIRSGRYLLCIQSLRVKTVEPPQSTEMGSGMYVTNWGFHNFDPSSAWLLQTMFWSFTD